MSVTNTTGESGHIHAENTFLLILCVFPVFVMFCHEGCVWTELFLPDSVQRGRHGCR